MKLLTVLFLLTLSLSTLGTEFLTDDQKSEVLTRIDNICGDTWCGGDFDFSFDEMECSLEEQSCSFTFDLLWFWDLDDELSWEERQDQAPRYTATCTLKGYTRYEQFVNSTGYDLKWDFYEHFTEKCVGPAEERAYPVIGNSL